MLRAMQAARSAGCLLLLWSGYAGEELSVGEERCYGERIVCGPFPGRTVAAEPILPSDLGSTGADYAWIWTYLDPQEAHDGDRMVYVPPPTLQFVVHADGTLTVAASWQELAESAPVTGIGLANRRGHVLVAGLDQDGTERWRKRRSEEGQGNTFTDLPSFARNEPLGPSRQPDLASNSRPSA